MNLKSFCEDKLKLSLHQFAELIEEDVSSLIKWENGDGPHHKTIQKIYNPRERK